jgi:hypothetical protein
VYRTAIGRPPPPSCSHKQRRALSSRLEKDVGDAIVALCRQKIDEKKVETHPLEETLLPQLMQSFSSNIFGSSSLLEAWFF